MTLSILCFHHALFYSRYKDVILDFIVPFLAQYGEELSCPCKYSLRLSPDLSARHRKGVNLNIMCYSSPIYSVMHIENKNDIPLFTANFFISL